MLMDKIIGHRGICGVAPENTMAGFYIKNILNGLR